MDKYIVKTDSLKGFSMNDIIEPFNDFQYGREDATIGSRCITQDMIDRNPEWFIKVERRSDFFDEIINDWDEGRSIWSIEMGGMGPGYEQAIQVLFVETLRRLTDRTPTFKQESKEDWETVKQARDKALKKLDSKWGYSGAQVGAAANLAYQFWVKTPYKVMKDDHIKDRKIQVSNNMTFK